MAGDVSKFLFVIIAAMTVLAAGNATAQDKTYLEEYKAYNAALAAGDNAAAAIHGYNAWQAAEQELGDNELTAILAYNYGSLTIYTDPEKAYAALSRADALARAGIVALPQRELALYLAFAEFKLDVDNRGTANALRKLLSDADTDVDAPVIDAANMWFELATADMSNKRYRDVQDSAARAEAAIASAYPDNYRSRAAMAMYQGVAILSSLTRNRANLLKSIEAFRRASKLFPRQNSIDDFDVILAQAFAWEAAVRAVYITHDFERKRLPNSESEALLFAPEWDSLEDCGGVWEVREPPNYPKKELRSGYVGAVLIGYRFADDTSVHDVRIMAEVPEKNFGAAVLEEVSNWKLLAPLPDESRCRDNRVSMVTFVIN